MIGKRKSIYVSMNAELRIRVVRSNSNNCGFGISDFGNNVKYLYFLQNIEAYTSEIRDIHF